ncbi:unnamed protein product [Lactuca saligna]|uniref:Uncharacterized protein n=1 Tax=Lactuca saligna TaxID=75948 RepID=A0AA35YR88_LACSI|nr:unnamed protein product [Lactuca saligna]
MPSEMLCKLLNVSSINHFEGLREDAEVDEGGAKRVIGRGNKDNLDQMSMMKTVVNDMPLVRGKNGKCSHVFSDHKSQVLFYQDKHIEDFDYQISQEFVAWKP